MATHLRILNSTVFQASRIGSLHFRIRYNSCTAIGSHTIPRFYLEQFATPTRLGKPGRVWVYEKERPPQLRSTRSQGRENGYFQIIRDDGKKDEFTETALAEFEDECLGALVSAKFALCDLALVYVKLASYAGMMFQRSTVRRKFSARNWSKLEGPYTSLASNQEYLQDVAVHYTDLTGQTFTSQQIAELILKQSAIFTDINYTRSTFVKDLWMHIDICKQEMLKKSWQVWHAPQEVEFVTSDNPVVTFLRFLLSIRRFGILDMDSGPRMSSSPSRWPRRPV